MAPLGNMPSASSMFSAYASMSATMMLFRSMFYDLVPSPLRHHLSSALLHLLKRRSTSHELTLLIEDDSGITRNEVYDAAQTYLSSKISPNTSRLRISKDPKHNHLTIRFDDGEKIFDSFEGIPLNWTLKSTTQSSDDPHDQRGGGGGGGRSNNPVKRFFQLTFDKQYREAVLGSYLPFVVNRSKAIKVEKKAVKLFTLGSSYSYGPAHWESINLEHPATFDKLAMDPEQKRALIDDLDRFVRRKEFYKRVGRAWKRGYLLYGPPGTGKSSLVAALANYLRFDIYDLQLANIMRDSDLRKLLLSTSNSSILVIEDIDCSVELPERRQRRNERKPGDSQLTLSGLLNFVDGLWSSCGDERIIIFTTNHKEKLDPALLRPGRMDLHVHMSYCTPDGFHLLASNYLGVSPTDELYRHLFREIEQLMTAANDERVTPAQVAEEFMKTEDVNVALEGIVKLLKRKREIDDDGEEKKTVLNEKAKMRRICGGGGMDRRKAVRNCLLRRTKLAMQK